MREKYEDAKKKAKETLAKALKDLGEIPKNRGEQLSTLFIIWFILVRLTDKLDLARGAVTDGANDKGCDAVLIDENARKVFVIQAKHSARFGEATENPKAIRDFAKLGARIQMDDDARVEKILRSADPMAAAKLRDAREAVHERNFELKMFFVTCRRASADIKAEFEFETEGRGVVLDADALVDIIDEWEKDYAPPIHELHLKMDSEKHVRYEDQRTDGEKVETWIFQMRGDELARLLTDVGPRIFAANVRGNLKKTSVNKAMAETLAEKPENFFHRNNGVTIACRGAELTESGVLLVRSPQIINGQQTTRTLTEFAAKDPGQVAAARVLTRVFVEEHGDALVSSVVRGVNEQNPIKASDLISNDPMQVALERELRKIGFIYQRKRERGTKREVMARLRNVIPGALGVYKKEDFARAVAGCNLDPAEVRGGLDNLFRDKYESLFPDDDPYYYLSRCSLVEAVTAGARGNSRRAYAKWVTTGFMWKALETIVEPKQRQFFDMWLSKGWVEDALMKKALGQAIDMVFVEVLKFYREEKRNTPQGKKRKDISTFFKDTRDLAGKFRYFWRNNASATKRGLFATRLAEIRSALDNWE